jgi:acyl dehydratase
MKYFEDLQIGEKTEVGSYTFTAESIKAFAARFDPQPQYLDDAAAARTPDRLLCASGWHVACAWMKLRIESRDREDAARRARGEAIARLGPSPGFRDLRWLAPVYPGDIVTYAAEIIDKRASLGRPGWGLLTSRNTGANQTGEPVIAFISSAFVERRPAEPMA